MAFTEENYKKAIALLEALAIEKGMCKKVCGTCDYCRIEKVLVEVDAWEGSMACMGWMPSEKK